MARIAGVNIPNHQHTVIGLQAIYGIGKTRAQAICQATGVTESTKVKDLTDAEMEKLRDEYARATAPQDRMRIAEAAQVLNAGIVTQIPLGEFWGVIAVRSNVVLQHNSMVTIYWGIDKR